MNVYFQTMYDFLRQAFDSEHDQKKAVLIDLFRLAAMLPCEAIDKSCIRAHYDAIKNLAELHDNITTAMKKAKDRNILRVSVAQETFTIQQRLEKRQRMIPLGKWQEQVAREEAMKREPRRKNWELPTCTFGNDPGVMLLTNDQGRYSSRCTYTHYTYDIKVASWGMITHTGLLYHYRDKVFFFPHPHGYRWKQCGSIALTRGKRAFYVNGSDLLAESGKPRPLRYLTAKTRESKP